jgi:biotin transport system substrate-specific component
LKEPIVNKQLSSALNPKLGVAQTYTADNGTSSTVASRLLRPVAVVLAGSAFVAVCAHIALPLYFTPVPLSMAPFAVLLLGLVLRADLAAATLAAYLAEGAIGLPVFSPTPSSVGGLAHLIGPTGGYLLSYPFAAALIALLVRRFASLAHRSFAVNAAAAAIGSLFILACGGTWLALLSHQSPQAVVKLAVLPFLPGDALKVVVAAALASGWTRVRRAR